MKVIFTVVVYLFSISSVFSQSVLEWSNDYKLQKSDFEASKNTGDGTMYSVHAAISINFGFQMSNYEFMFSKNFNSKVSPRFARNASYIIAPDGDTADKLLKLAQVEFDLAELYARKFRKLMFENKKAFSEPDFYQKLYEKVYAEFTMRNSQIVQNTNMGMAEIRLKENHDQVLIEIDELADFCKTCKPKKRKVGKDS